MPDIAELRARLTATSADLTKGFADAAASTDTLGSSFSRLKDNIEPVNTSIAGIEKSLTSLGDVGGEVQLPLFAETSKQTADLEQNVGKLAASVGAVDLSKLGQAPAGLVESAQVTDALADSLGRAATAGANFSSVGTALGRQLAVIATTGDLSAESIARIGVSLGKAAIETARFATASATSAQAITQVFAQLAAINPGRTIADVADQAAKLATTNPAAPLAKIAEASARLAAVNPGATIGAIATQAARLQAAAAPAVGIMEQFGAALLRFGPLAFAGGAGVALFTTVLKDLGDAAERSGNKIVANFAKSAEAIKGFQQAVNQLSVEVATAKLKTFQDETDAMVQKVLDDAQKVRDSGGFIAQGTIDGNIVEIKRLRTELAGVTADAESQTAGKALEEEIRKGVEGALAELAKLEKGLQVPGAEKSFAQLQSLASELNFRGPLSDLQALGNALTENATKVRAIGEAQQFTEESIRSEIGKTNALIKQRFTEEQKLKFKLDQASLDAVLSKVEAGLAKGAKPIEIRANVNQALQEMEKLRAQGLAPTTQQVQRLQSSLDSLGGAEAKATVQGLHEEIALSAKATAVFNTALGTTGGALFDAAENANKTKEAIKKLFEAGASKTDSAIKTLTDDLKKYTTQAELAAIAAKGLADAQAAGKPTGGPAGREIEIAAVSGSKQFETLSTAAIEKLLAGTAKLVQGGVDGAVSVVDTAADTLEARLQASIDKAHDAADATAKAGAVAVAPTLDQAAADKTATQLKAVTDKAGKVTIEAVPSEATTKALTDVTADATKNVTAKLTTSTESSTALTALTADATKNVTANLTVSSESSTALTNLTADATKNVTVNLTVPAEATTSLTNLTADATKNVTASVTTSADTTAQLTALTADETKNITASVIVSSESSTALTNLTADATKNVAVNLTIPAESTTSLSNLTADVTKNVAANLTIPAEMTTALTTLTADATKNVAVNLTVSPEATTTISTLTADATKNVTANLSVSAGATASITTLTADATKNIAVNLAVPTEAQTAITTLTADATKAVAVNVTIPAEAQTAITTLTADSQKNIAVKVDTESLTATIAQIGVELAKISDKKITVKLDISALEADLKAIPEPITSRNIAIHADLTAFNAEIAAIPAQVASRTVTLNAAMKGSPTLPVSEYLTNYLPKLLTDLGNLTPTVTVGTEVKPPVGLEGFGPQFTAPKVVGGLLAGGKDFKELTQATKQNSPAETNRLLREQNQTSAETGRAIRSMADAVRSSRTLSGAETSRLASGRRGVS